MSSKEPTHTLYHNLYSVCSLMVRYSFALRGSPKSPSQENEIRINEQSIALTGEQLTEHYLCDINANGEVPVLAPPEPAKPFPESVDITYYFAESYPSLLPAEWEGEIKRLIGQLHSLNFFSLTYTGRHQFPRGLVQALEGKLGEEGVSERYRRAIETKIARVKDRKLAGLDDQVVEDNIAKTRKLLQDFEGTLSDSGKGWCFGLEHPTALDGHFVVFLCRLMDVQRDELIPEKVKQYALHAMEGKEWKETMEGRRTVIEGFMNQT